MFPFHKDHTQHSMQFFFLTLTSYVNFSAANSGILQPVGTTLSVPCRTWTQTIIYWYILILFSYFYIFLVVISCSFNRNFRRFYHGPPWLGWWGLPGLVNLQISSTSHILVQISGNIHPYIYVSMYLCMYVCICKYIHPYTHITYSSSSIYSNPPSPSPTPTPSFIPSATARRWRAPPSPNGAADPNASVRWPGRCSGTLGTCGLDAPNRVGRLGKNAPKKTHRSSKCACFMFCWWCLIFFLL